MRRAISKLTGIAVRAGLFALMVIATAAALATPATADPTADVVGGTEVPFSSTEWDFMTQVIVTDGVFDYFVCGGSLIRRDWVLTAAHCTDAGLPISYVVAGTKNFSGGFASEVVDEIVHPGYIPGSGENDLALLKLAAPALAGTPLTKLGTAQTDPIAPKTVRVAGWGDTFFGSGDGSDQLLEADVEIVSNQDCDDVYQSLPQPATIFGSMICAAHFDGPNSRDTCQGDSGGPLVDDQADGPTLVGVTQGGEGCAQSPYPGIYSRVSSALGWIDASIGTSIVADHPQLETSMDLPPGQVSTIFVTVRNVGSNEIRLAPAQVAGSGFSLESDLCGSATPFLAPQSSCRLGIRFSTTSAGSHSGEVRIATDSISKPLISVPIDLTSAYRAKPRLVFARGFGGFTKSQGRVLRRSDRSNPVVKLALEAKIPPSVNPDLKSLRCGAPGYVQIRYPGRKKAYRAKYTLGTDSAGRCFVVAYVKLAKNSLGKRVKVTARTQGTTYSQPTSFRGTLRIAKKVK